MTFINGTPASGTPPTPTLTVPVGVTAGMTAMIMFGTSDGSDWDPVPAKAGATFTLIDDRAAVNHRVTFWQATGLVAGDVITTSSTGSESCNIWHVYTDEFKLIPTPVAAGVRTVTEVFTTSTSITPLAGQRVVLIANERTSATPTTVSSAVSSGGETITTHYFNEQSNTISSHFIGSFIASAAASRTATITYNHGSTNGYAALLLASPLPVSGTIAAVSGVAGTTANTRFDQDDFTGTTGTAWNAAWSAGTSPTGGSTTIQGNAGQQVTGSATNYNFNSRTSRKRATQLANVVHKVKFTYTGEIFPNIWVRGDSNLIGGTGYALVMSPGIDVWNVNGWNGFATIFSGPDQAFNFTAGTTYVAEFGAVGTLIQARVYQDGNPVPPWQYSTTDATLTTGYYGLGAFPGNAGGTQVTWDDWEARSVFPDTAAAAQSVAGVVTTTSAVAGQLIARRILSGAVAAVSGVAGNVTIIPFVPPQAVAGQVNAVSGVAGTGSLVTRGLSGQVDAVSGAAGQLGASGRAVAGRVDAVSGAAGATRFVGVRVQGVVAAVSGVAGLAGKVWTVSGRVDAVSAAFGNTIVTGKPGQGSEVLELFNPDEVLLGGRVTIYQFDLLDQQENLLGTMQGVEGGEVYTDAYSAVKGTGSLDVYTDPEYADVDGQPAFVGAQITTVLGPSATSTTVSATSNTIVALDADATDISVHDRVIVTEPDGTPRDGGVYTVEAISQNGAAPPIVTWLSGAYTNLDGPTLTQMGTWRGRAMDMSGQFPTRTNSASLTNNYWLSATYSGGAPHLAVGMPMCYSGGSLAQDLSADCTSMATAWAVDGREFWIRLGWEMNLSTMPWVVTDANLATWKSRFNLYAGIFKSIMGSKAHIVFNPNFGSNSGGYTGTMQDLVTGLNHIEAAGPDCYDWYNGMTNDANTLNFFTRNQGLNFWADFARDNGWKLCLPEWGVAHGTSPGIGSGLQGNDNPRYITEMINWMASEADNMVFDCYFNEYADYIDSDIFRKSGDPATVNPLAAARYQSNFTPVTSGHTTITFAPGAQTVPVFGDVLRTVSVTSAQDIDWLNVRIRPMIRIQRLGGGDDPDGRLVPAGVFLCAAPVENWDATGLRRKIELADKLSILDQDIASGSTSTITSYGAPAGANIIDLVTDLIGETGERYPAIEPGTGTLPSPLLWDIGTTRLKIINDLLDAGGYFSLWVDGWGQYQVTPYVQPSDRTPVYSSIAPFSSGPESLMSPDWVRDRDFYSVPNRYVCVSQGDGDTEALVSEATNEDALSPYSFPRRGRWITTVEVGVEAVTQAALDTITRGRLAAATSITNQITVKHVFLPDLLVNSVVRFVNPGSDLDIYCYVVGTSIPFDPTELCTTIMRVVS